MKKYLYNNRITDTPGVTFPGSLVKLHLSNNAQTRVPGGLAGLTRLDRLYLYNNNIIDVDSAVFPSSLSYLYLDNNKITNISSLTFSNTSSSLTDLYLNSNPLQHISPSAFTQLTHLTHLFLHSTHLTRLPLALASLTRLDTLYMSYNRLTCTCEEAALSPWFTARPSLSISGDCDGGVTIKDFLQHLATNCDPGLVG